MTQEAKDITIVVAEDSAPNRKILVTFLKKYGFEVQEYEDGIDAKNYLEKLSLQDAQKIGAIISDVMMPEWDGITLLEWVRSRKPYQNLPFVIVSAANDDYFVEDAKRFEANSYLMKPLTNDKIYKLLTTLFPELKIKNLAAS